MIDSVKPMVQQLGINAVLFDQHFKDIKPEEIPIRPRDRANSMLWIAGHIMNSRYGLANLIGAEGGHPWGDIFSRGAELQDPSAYPSFEEIRKEWDKAGELLMKRLEEVTDEDLAPNCPYKFPVDDNTLLGAIIFLTYHETYHIGQLAYTRRIFGYDQLVG